MKKKVSHKKKGTETTDCKAFDCNVTYLLCDLLPLALVLHSAEADPLLVRVFVVAGVLVFSHQAFLGRLRLDQWGVAALLPRQLPPLPGSVDEGCVRDLTYEAERNCESIRFEGWFVPSTAIR